MTAVRLVGSGRLRSLSPETSKIIKKQLSPLLHLDAKGVVMCLKICPTIALRMSCLAEVFTREMMQLMPRSACILTGSFNKGTAINVSYDIDFVLSLEFMDLDKMQDLRRNVEKEIRDRWPNSCTIQSFDDAQNVIDFTLLGFRCNLALTSQGVLKGGRTRVLQSVAGAALAQEKDEYIIAACAQNPKMRAVVMLTKYWRTLIPSKYWYSVDGPAGYVWEILVVETVQTFVQESMLAMFEKFLQLIASADFARSVLLQDATVNFHDSDMEIVSKYAQKTLRILHEVSQNSRQQFSNPRQSQGPDHIRLRRGTEAKRRVMAEVRAKMEGDGHEVDDHC